MKIDKKIIEELVGYLKEFNLSEIEYSEGATKVKVSRSINNPGIVFSETEKKKSIIKDTTNYYTKTLNRFGPTFQGVDWNSKESQELRFDQLIKVIDKQEDNFSILDSSL